MGYKHSNELYDDSKLFDHIWLIDVATPGDGKVKDKEVEIKKSIRI